MRTAARLLLAALLLPAPALADPQPGALLATESADGSIVDVSGGGELERASALRHRLSNPDRHLCRTGRRRLRGGERRRSLRRHGGRRPLRGGALRDGPRQRDRDLLLGHGDPRGRQPERAGRSTRRRAAISPPRRRSPRALPSRPRAARLGRHALGADGGRQDLRRDRRRRLQREAAVRVRARGRRRPRGARGTALRGRLAGEHRRRLHERREPRRRTTRSRTGSRRRARCSTCRASASSRRRATRGGINEISSGGDFTAVLPFAIGVETTFGLAGLAYVAGCGDGDRAAGRDVRRRQHAHERRLRRRPARSSRSAAPCPPTRASPPARASSRSTSARTGKEKLSPLALEARGHGRERAARQPGDGRHSLRGVPLRRRRRVPRRAPGGARRRDVRQEAVLEDEGRQRPRVRGSGGGRRGVTKISLKGGADGKGKITFARREQGVEGPDEPAGDGGRAERRDERDGAGRRERRRLLRAADHRREEGGDHALPRVDAVGRDGRASYPLVQAPPRCT